MLLHLSGKRQKDKVFCNKNRIRIEQILVQKSLCEIFMTSHHKQCILLCSGADSCVLELTEGLLMAAC